METNCFGLRDLALQKIGMKWAWMDGVTYRDWQDFHDLRSRLTEWTHSVKNLVVTHPGIEDAEAAAQDIEDAAMKIAQVAEPQADSAAATRSLNDYQVALHQIQVPEDGGPPFPGGSPAPEARSSEQKLRQPYPRRDHGFYKDAVTCHPSRRSVPRPLPISDEGRPSFLPTYRHPPALLAEHGNLHIHVEMDPEAATLSGS